jgi:tetratricopeptide (TPR) repeat protein
MGVWGLADLPFTRTALAVACGLALLACAWATFLQVRHWYNDEALWTQNYRATPRNFYAASSLGNMFKYRAGKALERGDTRLANGLYTRAKKYFEQAVEWQPQFPAGHYNLAGILVMEGKREEAAREYLAAARASAAEKDWTRVAGAAHEAHDAAPPEAKELRQAAKDFLLQALVDSTNHLARWVMLNYYMSRHEYGLPADRDPFNSAVPYALNLVDFKQEDYIEEVRKDYALQQVSVYYVLAWRALHDRSPQKTLDFLKKGDEFDQQDVRAKGKSGTAVPRWRELGLEVQALAELKKRAAGKKDKNEEAAEQLRGKLQDGLARALQEAEEKLPERTKEGLFKEAVPRTRTVKWLAVTDSPTDLPGLLDFLAVAVREAAGPGEVLQTSRKVTQVCAKLAEDPHPPASVPKALENFLCSLSDFAAETEAKKKPGTGGPSPKDWRTLHEQIDKVLQAVLTKNSDSKPVSYLILTGSLLDRVRSEKDLEGALATIVKGLDSIKSAQEKNKDAPEKTRKDLVRVEMGLRLHAAQVYLRLGQTAKAAEQLPRRHSGWLLACQTKICTSRLKKICAFTSKWPWVKNKE